MKISEDKPKIVVVGSSSVDLILKTNHFPKPNETVLSTSTESYFGGKGANQAIACSRLGAQVHFVGSVGMDPNGQQIMRNMVSENINVGFVSENMQHPSGTAYATSAEGNLSIIVSPAANMFLSKNDIDNASKVISNADFVLTQLEIPLDVVEYLIEKCALLNVKIGLYASPASKIKTELLDKLSFIIIKDNDFATIFGEGDKETILKKYANKLIVRVEDTMTIYHNGSEVIFSKTKFTDNRFKMGMGDAFTAGFCMAHQHGNSIGDCVDFGNLIALKTAEKSGSQTALPYLRDLEI